MRNSRIPKPRLILNPEHKSGLKPGLIQNVLSLHCHENFIDDNYNVHALEIGTLNGKPCDKWHNLTGYTMKQLKDWLGY